MGDDRAARAETHDRVLHGPVSPIHHGSTFLDRIHRAMIGMVAGLAMASLGPTCDTLERPGVDTLTLGAYSVVREAFHDGLIPAFAREWERKTGRAVHFEESYNASGAQSR